MQKAETVGLFFDRDFLMLGAVLRIRLDADYLGARYDFPRLPAGVGPCSRGRPLQPGRLRHDDMTLEKVATCRTLDTGLLPPSALRQLLASYMWPYALGNVPYTLSELREKGLTEFTPVLMIKHQLVAYEPLVGASSSSASAKGRAASSAPLLMRAPGRRPAGRSDPAGCLAKRVAFARRGVCSGPCGSCDLGEDGPPVAGGVKRSPYEQHQVGLWQCAVVVAFVHRYIVMFARLLQCLGLCQMPSLLLRHHSLRRLLHCVVDACVGDGVGVGGAMLGST